MDRSEVELMKCLLCKCVQPKSGKCINPDCYAPKHRYYCGKCSLWENKANKEIRGWREEKRGIGPFVFLPEVAGEGDEQHCGESPNRSSQPNPELHTSTGQRFLFRQGHTSHAQLWFSPHIQQVLRMNMHT